MIVLEIARRKTDSLFSERTIKPGSNISGIVGAGTLYWGPICRPG